MPHVVLLGDSIFDNASYVPPAFAVIDQLEASLPGEWTATLLAVDGALVADVDQQIDRLPRDATHLILSCGGNNALDHLLMLAQGVRTAGEALFLFDAVRRKFQSEYESLLSRLIDSGRALAVCTVYDTVPEIDGSMLTALAMFNELILRLAIGRNLPVLDLRHVFEARTDYSELSPIEPSAAGGAKLVRAIVNMLAEHDFATQRSVIYT
jgi:hypothetical protein